MKYWCYYTDVVRYLERLEALYSQKKAEGPAYLVWQDDDGPSMIAGPGIEWHRGDGPPPDIDAINVRIGRPSAPRRRPSNRAASARLRSTPRPNSQDRAPQRNTASPQCRQRAASATAPGVAHRSAVPPRACGAWSGESRSTVLQDLLLDRIASVLALRWATSRSLAPNNPTPTGAPAPRPPKKANKRSTNFPKPAQTCSPGRQSVKFPKSAQTYSQHRKKQQSRRRQPAVKTPNHLPSPSPEAPLLGKAG